MNDPIELIKGMAFGAGLSLIIYFGVFKPSRQDLKAYWLRFKLKICHPFKKLPTYKSDEEIYFDMPFHERIEMIGKRIVRERNSRIINKLFDWGIGNKDSSWWIGEDGRDNNSMLH